MTLRLLPAALAVALLASGAAAQVPVFSGPVAISPIDLSRPPALRDFGLDHAPSCMEIYLNETNSTGFYVPVGKDVELADDLHTTSRGREALCAVDLGYFKSTLGPVNAVITIYDNYPGDDLPGAVLAGPFLIEGLPSGVNAFHIEVPGGMVDEDVWMGVAFDDNSTGLLTFDPATLGLSHDLARIGGSGGSVGNWGGTPPASFYLGVYSSPSTPIVPLTWGALKSHYR
jgi:hypothetical protein